MKKRLKNKCIKNNIRCSHTEIEISGMDIIFWCKKYGKECEKEYYCKSYCIRKGHFKYINTRLSFLKHLTLKDLEI